MGSAILLVNTNEYKNAQELVEDNKRLIEKTVRKTLSYNLNIESLKYPSSLNDIDAKWKELIPNFSLFENKKLIYPLRFKGLDNKGLSPLWMTYQVDGNNLLSQDGLISTNTLSRNKVLSSIKKLLALETENDRLGLEENIREYFDLLANFQLEPIEEIISMLAFLKLHDKSRWNDKLVESIVFSGSTHFQPIIHYLFRQNSQLSKADAKKIIKFLQVILEQTNINLTWLHSNTKAFFDDSLNIDLSRKSNILISKNLVIIKRNNKINLNISTLALPISLLSEIEDVKKTLVNQGILEKLDTIILTDIRSNTSLENLEINVYRSTWINQRTDIRNYFIFKIGFTLLFVMALIVMVFFISLQNKRKLEHINLKENFLNLVSHELRTPLASIRLMTETLKKRNDRRLDIKDYPLKIIGEVDRLWLMVDNLLSLNQIKSGELHLNISEVFLVPLINRVADRLSESSSQKFNLKLDVLPDFTIQVDQTLFELVIVNLISNSVKYCDKGTCEINVFIDKDRDSIMIVDNACGIDEKNKLKVFDDFYRIKQEGNVKGTGVGLSLCAQILKLHRGNITIYHSNSNGTTWEIKLPGSKKGN